MKVKYNNIEYDIIFESNNMYYTISKEEHLMSIPVKGALKKVSYEVIDDSPIIIPQPFYIKTFDDKIELVNFMISENVFIEVGMNRTNTLANYYKFYEGDLYYTNSNLDLLNRL